MSVRQCLKARADVLELIDFAQDRLKRHGYTTLAENPKAEELQMDWLMVRRPERGEGGNHPVVTITRQKAICLIKLDL
jgi:hypothetical protein